MAQLYDTNVIVDAKLKKKLLTVMYDRMAKAGGPFASCFNPRHGIRATQGTNSVDRLICFECDQIVEYAWTSQRLGLKSDRGNKLFNQTLIKAGVPLAKRWLRNRPEGPFEEEE